MFAKIVSGRNQIKTGNKKPELRKKVIVFIDFENLNRGYPLSPTPHTFSFTENFGRMINHLRMFGEIVFIFVFMPVHCAQAFAKFFYDERCQIVLCPKSVDKTATLKDTVDQAIMDFGRKITNEIPGLSFVFLASGDKDFVPFVKDLKLQGLTIGIIASARPPASTSLSQELALEADKDPRTGEPLVLYLKDFDKPRS